MSPSRTPKCTCRRPWTSIRSTTLWSCLPLTMTPVLWLPLTRSVNTTESNTEPWMTPVLKLWLVSVLCRHVVASSTTMPSPGWLSHPASHPSCWQDTVTLCWRRGEQGQIFHYYTVADPICHFVTSFSSSSPVPKTQKRRNWRIHSTKWWGPFLDTDGWCLLPLCERWVFRPEQHHPSLADGCVQVHRGQRCFPEVLC